MSTTINASLDSKLADLMRLSRNEPGGEVLTIKIGRGREQMTSLGGQIASLRTALARLAAPRTDTMRWIENVNVTARSRELGLSYDEGVPANDDRNKLLSTLAGFGGIAAGSFRINTVPISVDPAADTLNDVLTRINASGAGVTASIEPGTDRLVIEADSPRKPILIEENSTGFFTATRLAPRAYAPPKGSSTAFAEPGKLVADMGEAVKAINGILKGDFGELDADTMAELKTGLKEALIKGLGGSVSDGVKKHIRSKYGFEIDFTAFAEERTTFDAKVFTTKALDDYDGLLLFLAGDSVTGVQGLAKTISSAFDTSLNKLVDTLGAKFAQGIMVDLKA